MIIKIIIFFFIFFFFITPFSHKFNSTKTFIFINYLHIFFIIIKIIMMTFIFNNY
ncbi:hypothetical protein GLOIN_2v1580297 [Rhizophagus irregularis DAOM 181602=DAOM 197198]|uniref:Uncharacterized protein n=1 Tax=Rhizophagus irregularis (strain DAOM 181602 / DAOM 197198 / MUCL 43194) TaxID=747089 RepID=A0A2P4Q8S6_RHIID|nr:hypothetical protein GLOIN_2v1580297 [Rhizophagus irregularis DAOM 181602=DAOM 197198]POG74044.1 hypothetical protein GLOIN_2v1580297 [Rhizophagus irregularis DAOM 181602=DAOM 197198]|eukprot:XP_025180910.1 hypothetical protein GLOIN_2v1580297 [Rhizophagus irregularis DAOM 181602=DAOM 197198]